MKEDIVGQVETYIKDIEKEVGKGEVFLLGKKADSNIKWLPLESIKLCKLLGKGVPFSRILEFYGPESGGKTTLASYIVAQAQKEGYNCAYIDVEQAFDPKHAKEIGIDIDKLYFSQPTVTEDCFRVLESMLDNIPNLGIVVVDSVAGMVPRAELDGDFGDSNMGLQARLMNQALRKLNKKIADKKTTVIFINQLRSKIGVMFGNPETTTGGNGLKFYASIRLDIRRVEWLGDKENPVGIKMKVKTIKNKVAPPFRQETLDVYFEDGIDEFGEFIDFGVDLGIVDKSGSWYTLPDGAKMQGKEKIQLYYLEHNKEYSELKELIWKKMEL